MKLSKNDSFVRKKRKDGMDNNIRKILDDWPKIFIRDDDLTLLLDKTDNARYSIVKRALKAGLLIRVRRGLYLISSKLKKQLPDEFELALQMYAPSFVSLESALSYHGWIPEVAYVTTCVSTKRAQEFETPIGVFNYKRVPAEHFYMGVDRIETQGGVMLVASAWRALADFMYTRRKTWESLEHLEIDLRIDRETLVQSDKRVLKLLIQLYPSKRVRLGLEKILQEIVERVKEKK